MSARTAGRSWPAWPGCPRCSGRVPLADAERLRPGRIGLPDLDGAPGRAAGRAAAPQVAATAAGAPVARDRGRGRGGWPSRRGRHRAAGSTLNARFSLGRQPCAPRRPGPRQQPGDARQRPRSTTPTAFGDQRCGSQVMGVPAGHALHVLAASARRPALAGRHLGRRAGLRGALVPAHRRTCRGQVESFQITRRQARPCCGSGRDFARRRWPGMPGGTVPR